jgi:hypothetical protein
VTARGDDLFEISVFHARVNEPGQLGLELCSNYVARGVLARDAPEASPDRVLYEMLEPSIGIARGWEAAIHLGLAQRPDGTVDAGEMKYRFMGVAPKLPGVPLKLAVNLEGGYLNARFEPARWTGEIRPILELSIGDLDVDLNPVMSFGWTEPHAGIPRFEPEAAVRYTVKRGGRHRSRVLLLFRGNRARLLARMGAPPRRRRGPHRGEQRRRPDHARGPFLLTSAAGRVPPRLYPGAH